MSAPNLHAYAVPALVPDLLAAGLDVAEMHLAPGVWVGQCPACVARDWPDPHEHHLRILQLDPGEPGELSCANGCTYLDIVAATAKLVRQRLTSIAPTFVSEAA